MRSYPGFSANFSGFGDEGDEGGGGGSVFVGKDWERTMSGGIVVEWPFFDGHATSGKIIKARALLQQQQVALSKLEEQVQLEVRQGLLNLQSSDEFMLSQIGNVDNAEESLRLAQVAFREGTATSLDVISAELSLSQARADYNQAVHDYQLSQLKLRAAIGVIGEEDIPEKS